MGSCNPSAQWSDLDRAGGFLRWWGLVSAATTTITEQITQPGGLPTAPRLIPVTADLTRDYVAGDASTSAMWYANATKAWPWSIDDLTQDYGDDLYDRMLCDSVVASTVNVLRAAIIEDGVIVAPSTTDQADPHATLAAEIADLANQMLTDLDTPLDDVLWDMLGAIALGNRVAELVYAVRPVAGKQRLMLHALRVKPRHSLAFVLDAYLRLHGFLARVPGEPYPLAAGQLIDPASMPNLLPRGKFAVLSFRPKDGNPLGTSVLRPAYTAWNLKGQTMQEFLKYLVQFASPLLIGTTPSNATRTAVIDATTGKPTGATIDPQVNLLNILLSLRNGSAMAAPYGTLVKELFSTGDGAAFRNAIADCNRDITLAVLGQTLATSEGQHQSRAAAEVHQDTLNTIVRQAKRSVVRMLTRDVLRPWVLANWGEAALCCLPSITLGTTESPDLTAMMNAVANLERATYLAPSQKPAIDLLLGLPQRTADEMLRDQEREAAPSPVPPVAPAGTDQQAQDTTSVQESNT